LDWSIPVFLRERLTGLVNRFILRSHEMNEYGSLKLTAQDWNWIRIAERFDSLGTRSA
jgi:hypothetical protein